MNTIHTNTIHTNNVRNVCNAYKYHIIMCNASMLLGHPVSSQSMFPLLLIRRSPFRDPYRDLLRPKEQKGNAIILFYFSAVEI
jgi:hypothetical protein